MQKKTIILQLNELNFDVLYKFAIKYDLKNLTKLFENYKSCHTEDEYEYLEPWIQWTSFYTGKKFKEHKIFKIGDTENSNLDFFPDKISQENNVGSFFAMNLPKIKNNSIFFPDPWIEAKGLNKIQKFVHKNLSFFVNNNSSKKIKIRNYLNLIIIIIMFFRIKKSFTYLKLIFLSLKKRYFKAILFDFLSFEIFNHYFKKNKFDLSLLFINGGAHIQHHHLLKFNQSAGDYPGDPFSIYLRYLDIFLKEFKDHNNYNLLLISGLSQKIIEKPIYYYRLNNHEKFLKELGVHFKKVQTLMSRDFVIHFDDNLQIDNTIKKLTELVASNNEKLFGDFKKYDKKLFLSSTFQSELDDIYLNLLSGKYFLKDILNFVAIKNSIHSNNCYFNYFGEFQTSLSDHKISNITDFNSFFLNFYDKN